jgi:TolB-like protein/DNA-binding winged helix-turn-helix (wHTH) protein/Tfp pilus assembly protein PilF
MPPQSQLPRVLRFGIFEVDVRAGELRKNGVKLRLQEQPFQVLCMLLEHPGDVVTREELRSRLWPANTFLDFDHGVNAAIERVRDALGDSPDNPRFVETLPRHGYRFIAAAVPDAIRPEKSHSLRRRWVLPVVDAVLVVIAAALLVLNAGGLRKELLSRSSAQHQIRSLAVLPLTNLSGDPEQEYFADGMTEELITELSRISSLKVVSRTSVTQYKGEKKKPLPQIGRELNVDAVMEGSVLRSDNRVRIAAHMIYAPTDQNLMAETYERDVGDVLKLQREVAESITRQVRVKLTPEQQARLRQAPEVNPDAYQAYLKATYLDWSQHKEVEMAQSYLEKAIEEDPSFAEAYARLAALQSIYLGESRWQSPREAFPSAKQAIDKALELDEKNCLAHLMLARISWRYDWDWQTADREYLYALKLCPSAMEAHYDYALFAASNGRSAEALDEMARMRELDPIRSEPFASKSFINYHLRNYKALIEVDRTFVARASNSWLAHYWVGVGYEGLGQAREAIPEYRKAAEQSQGDSDPTAALAHAYATTGRKAEALKILRDWQHQSETSYVSPYMIATVYAGLGDKDKAFEFLEKAYRERSPDLPYFLRADLRVDSLRSDARFQDLMHRMNFPNKSDVVALPNVSN